MKYRNSLPQLQGKLFLTDGGMETVLIFHQGIDLPEFAAFDLLKDEAGQQVITDYYDPYIKIAEAYGAGFILETATWRANPDWAEKLNYSQEQLDQMNILSVQMLTKIRDARESASMPMIISGCVGPRSDGYQPEFLMTSEQSEDYHHRQIKILNGAGVDMVTAITMSYPEEAIGITKAAKAEGIPVAISFTVETNGSLITGESLVDAIARVDQETDLGPAYYMINCAHPTHFDQRLDESEQQLSRIKGIRANASAMSHEELDEAEELDDGNPHEFGLQYRSIREKLPGICVFGGCCGTDHRHVESVAENCAGLEKIL